MPPADQRIQRTYHPSRRSFRARARHDPSHCTTIPPRVTIPVAGDEKQREPAPAKIKSPPSMPPALPPPASPAFDAAGLLSLRQASEPHHPTIRIGRTHPLRHTEGHPNSTTHRRATTDGRTRANHPKSVLPPPTHLSRASAPPRHTEERRPHQPPPASHGPQGDTHRPPPISL